MAPRAIWKGQLKIAELVCPVALHAAASTRERVAFTTVNRQSGHPLRRTYIDAETGKPVAKEDQVKGYETGNGEYVVLTADELAEAVPDSDKMLRVEGFLACDDVETIYFDRPYYLTPAGPEAAEAFAVIREGMRDTQTAALARAVLFRRVRTMLIRAHGPGLAASTLNFDYEVRSSREAFRSAPDPKIEPEMLDLARHIIDTKRGTFDPAGFDDRYDAALAELVRAKAEGREIRAPKPSAPAKVVSLLDALRESAGAADKSDARKSERASPRRNTPTKQARQTVRRKAG